MSAGARLAALRAALKAAPAARSLRQPRTSTPAPPPALTGPVTAASALVDSFGRRHTYLRMSLTERCNLRCTYCMPTDGAQLTEAAHLLTTEEAVRLAGVFTSAGVTKIRLTGGEPTLRRDLGEVVARLSALPGLTTLGMTTNGVVLEKMLPALRDAGLTHLNISCDTLRPARFPAISRRSEEHWHRVQGSIAAALGAGLRGPVKVNVVVERGVNDDEVADFVALTSSSPLHVRFIELMPFAGNQWRPEAVVPWRDMVGTIRERFPAFAPLPEGGEAPLPSGSAPTTIRDTARLWSVPGHAGCVGFITTMTDAFCSTCTRLRLTADGAVRACLHGQGEVSLRDVLRAGGDDAEVLGAIAQAVAGKARALGGETGLSQRIVHAQLGIPDVGGRPMVKIGG
jgi:molybdenum cofactor biosynthesis protein A